MLNKVIYIYGDSHAQTFIRAIPEIKERVNDVDFKFRCIAPGRLAESLTLFTKDGKEVINPTLTFSLEKDGLHPYKRYQKTNQLNNIKIYILLGSGLPHSMLVNPKALTDNYNTFFFPTNANDNNQSIPIFKSIMEEEIKSRHCSLFRALELFKELGYSNINVLASPPLHRDWSYILDRREVLRKYVTDTPTGSKNIYPSDDFRSKLYFLSDKAIEDKCNELGFNFKANPVSFCDPKGFLKVKYYRDGLHGNKKYAIDFALYLAQEFTQHG